MQTTQNSRIFSIVLAAGQSQRFGAPKLLQTLGDEPLVHRAACLARSISGERSLLVTGYKAADVICAANGQCQFIAVNGRYQDGIGTSIAVATRALAHTADAVLLLLADQALIRHEHLAALVAAWSGADNDIVTTAFAGVQGPPVLFPRGAFRELCQLEGDAGARSLLGNSAYRVTPVRCDAAAIDIDTPDDLMRLRSVDERE